MDKMNLGEFEELVLLAVASLEKNAYGVTIRKAMETAGRSASIGALYTTLDRLEEKGFISSRQGESTPERGGRAKKFFSIEGAGSLALEQAERVRRQMRMGIGVGFPIGGVA